QEMNSESSNTDRCWASQAFQPSSWNVAKITQPRAFASAMAAAYECAQWRCFAASFVEPSSLPSLADALEANERVSAASARASGRSRVRRIDECYPSEGLPARPPRGRPPEPVPARPEKGPGRA